MFNDVEPCIVVFPHSSLEFQGPGELRTWLIGDRDEKGEMLCKRRKGMYNIRYGQKTKHSCEMVEKAWRRNKPGRFPPPVGYIAPNSVVIFSFGNELVGDGMVEKVGFNKGDYDYPFWVKFKPHSVRIYPNRSIEGDEFKRLTKIRLPRQEYPRLDENQYRRILRHVAGALRKSLKSFELEEHLRSFKSH